MNPRTEPLLLQSPSAFDTVSNIAPKRVASESLLGEAKTLLIMHNGREYRLRVTQNGKLILTA